LLGRYGGSNSKLSKLISEPFRKRSPDSTKSTLSVDCASSALRFGDSLPLGLSAQSLSFKSAVCITHPD
jgi:hypothetical protein